MISIGEEILEQEHSISKQQSKIIQALHIDDDENFLEISKTFIEKLSNGRIRVDSLLDSTKAEEMLKSEIYDMIISDYQMPEINGLELLQNIRRAGINTPFIILTGKGREEVAILALNIGADYYLKKGSDAKSQFTELIHIIYKITHLKNIENALFESETRFRELVEKTNDGLFIQNQEGFFSYVNSKFCEILGYNKNELLGKKAKDFITENSRNNFLEEMKNKQQGVEPYELSWRKKDNQIIYTIISSETMFDKNNAFSGVFNIITDITQRKQIEQALIESEASYRNLVEISPDAIILSNLKGRVVFANKQTASLFGTEDVEELIGENIFKFFAYFDLKNALDNVKTVIDKGISKNKEYIINRKDGSYLPVEISSAIINDNQNKPISMLSILRDISGRKIAEEEIKEREENYSSLFKQMSEAFAYHKIEYNGNNIPEDFVILNVNSNYEKITGLNREDIIGTKISDIFPDIKTGSPNLLEKFGHVAQTGKPANFEAFFPHQNKWINISAYSPRRDYFATLMNDITEQKLIEEEKEERMKEKSFILGVFAHDMRSYQVVANGFIDLVIEKNPNIDLSSLKELKQAKASIVKANALLENLSIMKKCELDSSVNLRPLNICEAIIRVEQSLKESFPKRNIILDYSRVDDQTIVLADNQIDHLLFNLHSNAVKNTEGESVQINLELDKTTANKCTLSIIDFGKGINPEKRKLMFERFNELGRNSDSTGFGLFIVKTLVDRYNGNVWMENRIDEDYTKGSVFKIELNLV